METIATIVRTIILDDTLEKKTITPESQDTEFVRSQINGIYPHKNYLEYLRLAWANHYGIVMSPDIFWHIVANEVATHIKDNAEHYSGLFTTTPGTKQNIVVSTGDAQVIPLDQVAEELRRLIPTETDIFLPKFSTTNKNAEFAFIAAFADAMQVYYNYMMYMCGIPKVRVTGTDEDWTKLANNLAALGTILDKARPDYFAGLITLVGEIQREGEEFWKRIFQLVQCGSGHQEEVEGWITELYMNKAQSPDYIDNYPTSVSKVPYTFLNTGQKFEMSYGLFGSDEEDGFLVPDFGYVVQEIK